MSDFIKKISERFRQSVRRSKEKRAVERSLELFQITERDGEIWLECNGILVCPEYMFLDGAIGALKKIRELYVDRKK